MRSIVHITIGTYKNVPTQKELEEVLERFNSQPVFFLGVDDDITMIEIPDDQEYQIILRPQSDAWKPSSKEMKDISALFQAACKDPQGSALATRSGFSVTVHMLPKVNADEGIIYNRSLIYV